jgi:hypothetical protein
VANHLAVATITAALRQTIQDALDADVPGAKAQVGRPDAANGQDAAPVVNLFLYQVAPNAAGRNAHLPSRGDNGRSRGAAAVALDLHYLISFYGASKSYDAERLLGSVTRVLEHSPLITRALIEKIVGDDPDTLGKSDLARAPEVARAHPLHLGLDELSKLWSVLFQVPYALSIAYRLGAVVVETDTAGSRGPPATRVDIGSSAMDGPVIRSIEAAGGPRLPITWGSRIAIAGRGLAMHGLVLRIGGHDVVLANADVAAERIELTLDAATLGGGEIAVGAVLVQAVVPPPRGMPPHLGRVSDSGTFVLRPALSLAADAVAIDGAPAGAVADGRITVGAAPAIRREQTVRLLLDERAALDPQGRQLKPEPLGDAGFPAAALVFPFAQLKRSTYLVQLAVDGVASIPTLDPDPASATFGQIVGPLVTVP